MKTGKFNSEITRHDLKRLRKKYKLIQEDMGKVLGLSKQQVCNIETGRSEITPHVKQSIRLINFFNCEKYIEIVLGKDI